jgi:thioredoxin reductase (NADPH)
VAGPWWFVVEPNFVARTATAYRAALCVGTSPLLNRRSENVRILPIIIAELEVGDVIGDVGHGLTIILAGEVDITRHDKSGRREPIVTHRAGGFMGELAQLAGRPALVDAYAQGPMEALIIAPDRLRALLVAEAELGERIMRALILRRVGLLETGAGGPVIVGRADNGDVLRLEGFLSRKGHPQVRGEPSALRHLRSLRDLFPPWAVAT